MTGVKYELADIVKRFGKQLMAEKNLSPEQTKVLFNIVSCRTPVLGWNQQECNICGKVHYNYNSCGDRHCPKCQITKQAVWVDKLINATLPVKHYHIIFTVPHVLNDICLWNDRLYYDIMFSAVRRTLHSFGYTHFGAETGAVAILHSWGQNLSLHPHIHCLVPAVGFDLQGKWKHIGKYKNYLYPVHQLSDTFSGKFIDSIKRKLKKLGMPNAFAKQIEKAQDKKWVVYSEASMAGAEHVMHYLGQYTHRVAISNQRIINISDTHVTFIAKDYRDKVQKKPVTLKGVEFLKRFCMHIMPSRFVRIRRFGIYNHTVQRNQNLQFFTGAHQRAQKIEEKIETPKERIVRLIGYDPYECPFCNKGIMITIKKVPRIRSPAGELPVILWSALD